ncbi:MAG TPA: dihydrolipoamide acetyltransferase family protein, partial [Longimicrobium sp.]|nr:dihydrolipoamide acetyltransferase family protein [Longimicrobium sp.]
MPQMGESIAEGTVTVWRKQVGDTVQRDEPIMEIATDKVDAEIPSPVAGVLVEIVVREGETVEVGTVVGYIETEAGAAAAPSAAAPTAPAAVPGEKETSLPEAAVGQAETRDASPVTPSAAAPSQPADVSANGDGARTLEERLRTRSTPLVRKIAAEHGVEVSAVHGTGRQGRVTKDDILRYVEERKTAPAAPATAGASTPTQPPAQRPAAPARPAYDGEGFPWDEFTHSVQHPQVTAGPNDRVEPASRMTQIIADNMVLSRRISPHVHSYFEVDYTRIDHVRRKNKRVWEEQQGVKVTYTHFICWSVARALREHPKLNASYSDHQVIYRADVNLGVAVALDNGLIVPVVRNADELSLVGLAKRINDLATRARNKQLKPDEIQGGTFTITNPGIFGTTIGFPIISQPQVAI